MKYISKFAILKTEAVFETLFIKCNALEDDFAIVLSEAAIP